MTRIKILVTGGAGYVGSHACKAGAAAGYRSIVDDNLVYGNEEVRWGGQERGELPDRARLDAMIATRREGDPAELVSDPAKALAQLAWAPRWSEIDTIVASGWAWHTRHG